MRASSLKAQAELCRRHFYEFVRLFWPIIIPEKPIYNWHIPYLCAELQALAEQASERLSKHHDIIINIPPGTTKSTLCTLLFPAWCWTLDPTLRIITGSYSGELATEHSVKTRDVLRSDLYKQLFPEIELKTDQNSKTYYENTMGGSRMATSVGGTVTGKHAHIIIVDDPLNPKMAASEIERKTANDWLDKTLSTRKVDKAITPTILIMQRLHEDDCTGHWLAKQKQKLKHICLPAELSSLVKPHSLRMKYKRGLLDEKRLGRTVLQESKVDLGTYGYAGQFEQSPAPEEGGLLKKNWFKLTNAIPENTTWNFCIDPAYTASDYNDATALLAYSVQNNQWVIREVEAVRMEFPELLKYIVTFCQKNGYSSSSRIYIEPKASGKSLVQALKRETTLNVLEDKSPVTDKIARVQNISAIVEAGRVELLQGAWNEDFLKEVCHFPNAKHDDRVDCLVMALQKAPKGRRLIMK